MSERQGAALAARNALQNGRGVLILGGAGVGKTHLASLALASSDLDLLASDPVSLILTTELTTPFEGLAQLLDLPEPPTSDAEAAAALRLLLPPATSGRPALLRVEGAHLLDRSSAEVIARLCRRDDLLLLATARPIAGSMSPWHELWRDDVLDRLDVHDLSPADAQVMLTGLLGGPLQPEALHTLWDETDGNAFHLRALVADQRESGSLQLRDGVWVLTGAPAVGTHVLDVAEADLHGLSDGGLLALQGLALLGALRLSSMLDTIGRAPVDEVLRRGLIRTSSAREVPEVLVDLAHRLLGHAVRRGTPATVRHSILERAAAPDACIDLAPQTVLLMLDEGITIPARTVRSAVTTALARHRLPDVVAIVDAALAPTGLTGLSELETIALRIDRADAYGRLKHHDAAQADLREALPRLRRAAALTPADGELPQLVVRVTRLSAELAQPDSNDVDVMVAALAEGAAWLATLDAHPDRPQRERELEVARLTLLGYAGRHLEAQSAALELLADESHPHVVLPLVGPTGMGLLHSGRFDDARRIVTRFRPLATANRAPRREIASEIAVVAFFAQLWSGEIADLDGLASSALDVAHDTIPWAGAHVSRGLVAAANGAWSPARRELHTANTGSASAASRYGRAVEALAAAASGEEKDARALLTTVDDLPAGPTAVLEGEIRLLCLDTLVWLRDPAAHGAARDLGAWAREQDQSRIELEALHRMLVLRRWTDTAPDIPVLTRIEQVRPRVRSARATALVKHARALQHDDLDLIEIAERELNRRGLWLPPGRQALTLTHREREIAALARARLSSRVIADLLGVSARTVDSHLASVFTKLGVTSREDLSHALT